jgi:gentisate 1,2-dioxygenase
LLPYAALDRPRAAYPLRRFPWRETRAALNDLAGVTDANEIVQLAYVNPETGQECLPILGFSAIMLRPGEAIRPRRRSASAVLHVVEGEGQARIDSDTLGWSDQDTLAIPTHASVEIVNRSATRPAYLFQVDDAPMQRKLGFYEEFGDRRSGPAT